MKTFIKKIKDAEDSAKGPSMQLDKAAAKRFVHSALSRDQVYQTALKDQANDAEEAKEESQTTTNSKSKTKGKAKRSGSGAGSKSKRRRKQ